VRQVRSGEGWCGMFRCGEAGLVRQVWHGGVRYGEVRFGMVWFGFYI